MATREEGILTGLLYRNLLTVTTGNFADLGAIFSTR